MTPIRIRRSEKEIIARECADVLLPVEFFTIENNTDLLLACFGTDNPETMFRIGKIVGHGIELEELKKNFF